MIRVEEATHPRSSKNHVKMLMFPSLSSRHGFLFDLLAPWLPSSSGVIATSSPAQLGLGGANGVSLYRRAVGLSDWKKNPSSEVSCVLLLFGSYFHWISEDGSVDERQT